MITGTTRLYAIVGDPVAHVRSPEVYSQHFAEHGIDAIMIPAQVPEARFWEAVQGLLALTNLDGLLVTLPYKARMLAYAKQLGVTANLVRAVNALRREPDGSWTGDMFDGAGMVRGIERKGYTLEGRRALLVGCGGAGSAIAVGLAQARVQALRVVDHSEEKARKLVETLRSAFPDCDIDTGAVDASRRDLIVNASPVGMKPGDGLPVPMGPLGSHVLVADAVLSHGQPTALIAHAQSFGCSTFDGRDMHAGQMEAILGFFGLSGKQRGTAD